MTIYLRCQPEWRIDCCQRFWHNHSMLKQPFTMDNYILLHSLHLSINYGSHSFQSFTTTNKCLKEFSISNLGCSIGRQTFNIVLHQSPLYFEAYWSSSENMMCSQTHRQVGTTTQLLNDFTWLHHSSSLPSSIKESLYDLYVPISRPLFYHVLFYLNLYVYLYVYIYIIDMLSNINV